jgi:quinol monooxygenase YgiN
VIQWFRSSLNRHASRRAHEEKPMPDTFATVLIVPRSADNAAEIETLFAELAELAHAEGPGVLTYAYFRGTDGTYRMLERYSDPEVEHRHVVELNNAKVERLAELAEFRDIEILGDTTPGLERSLAPFGPIYRRYVTGVI